jgi:hypothetical protein
MAQIRKAKRCLFLPLPFNDKVLTNEKIRKGNRNYTYWKEGRNLSLFIYHMIVYAENPSQKTSKSPKILMGDPYEEALLLSVFLILSLDKFKPDHNPGNF